MVLFDLFHIVIFPVIFLISLCLVKVICILRRLVRCFDLLLKKSLPVVFSQPDVLLDFAWAIKTQSVAWLTLEEFVDEVCCLKRPSFRQLTPFDLNLFCENHVSDFFTASADVRSTAEHELVTNDANSKIICGIRVVLPAHDLWRHISWRP